MDKVSCIPGRYNFRRADSTSSRWRMRLIIDAPDSPRVTIPGIAGKVEMDGKNEGWINVYLPCDGTGRLAEGSSTEFDQLARLKLRERFPDAEIE